MMKMIENDAHRQSDVSDCRILTFPRRPMPGGPGSITTVMNKPPLPFDIHRIYYLYDVPADAERGGHSHHSEQRLIVAVAGSFDVTVDDGKRRKTFHLDRPYRALYIPAGIWRTIDNFSSGSVCLALASCVYDADDYVRDYNTFLQLTANKLR